MSVKLNRVWALISECTWKEGATCFVHDLLYMLKIDILCDILIKSKILTIFIIHFTSVLVKMKMLDIFKGRKYKYTLNSKAEEKV